MFLDEAVIDVKGGNGGQGCVAWRREKYVPRGGPSGGDGGRGGDIVFIADDDTDTLSDYASRKYYEAQKGFAGSGSQKGGHDGEEKVLKVPPGTLIWELPKDGDEGEPQLIADLLHDGDRVVVARGGRGGYGNAHFLSSTRQRPDFAELGEPGEERRLKLELKLAADVGIIGFPSVGKSTLISVISAARPKIAAYPFTTLVPNLGVVTVSGRSFVVSDLPGLIEGASEGKGLGDRFLKHIERCGLLLHVLDISRAMGAENEVDPALLVKDYRAIRHELIAYSPTLADKPEFVVLNKADLVAGDTKAIEKALKKEKIAVFASISAATSQGTDDLMKKILPMVLEEREKRAAVPEEDESDRPLPVLRPDLGNDRMGAYRIEQQDDGSVHVRGKRLEQFTKMTNFASSGAVLRFRDVIERIGLKRALNKFRKDEETQVFIGEINVTEYLP